MQTWDAEGVQRGVPSSLWKVKNLDLIEVKLNLKSWSKSHCQGTL